MSGTWWKRLGVSRPTADSVDGSLLESRISELEPGHADRLATFAALLARVAFSDGEISEIETHSLARIVAVHGKLSERDAETVSVVTRDRAVALQGVDNHLLTRRFNEVATEADKRRLIECLYAVAVADDLVTHVEDREIRQIARALLVPASTVLEIRSQHREKLEEIQEIRSFRETRGR
jgi:uncharacterized tellurite resistance protein B-like protein